MVRVTMNFALHRKLRITSSCCMLLNPVQYHDKRLLGKKQTCTTLETKKPRSKKAILKDRSLWLICDQTYKAYIQSSTLCTHRILKETLPGFACRLRRVCFKWKIALTLDHLESTRINALIILGRGPLEIIIMMWQIHYFCSQNWITW